MLMLVNTGNLKFLLCADNAVILQYGKKKDSISNIWLQTKFC